MTQHITAERATTPDLSVCICTHNRPAYLRDCLEGLGRQTEKPRRFEVIVVDSASDAAAAAELRRLVASYPGARLIVMERTGVSDARNAGAAAARADHVAFIDDDAIPAPDWVASILRALRETSAVLIGGRILPRWEAPLPMWWPRSLRGVLSIIEHEGQGEYRTAVLPRGLEPYAANMVVQVAALLRAGGFRAEVGRYGGVLLSDEEVQLAWTLQDAGHRIVYDSRIVVEHQIQARRLNPAWLWDRLFWQGASTVVTRRLLGQGRSVWPAAARRLAVALIFAPAILIPRNSARLIGVRWRLAYSLGFLRAALGRLGMPQARPPLA